MLKHVLRGGRGRLFAFVAALSPCLLALSLSALPGCANRAGVVQPKIEDLKPKIENEPAAPAVASKQESAKRPEAVSAPDQLADAGDSLAELVPTSMLQAVPDAPALVVAPPGAPDSADTSAPTGPANTAAEPAPVAQAQAPTISLELDSTELKPGAKLFGQVCGSWGNDVARLLWLDGKGRFIGEVQLKPPAEDASTVPFGLAQPEGGVGERHQLVIVRTTKAALARSEKDGTPVVFDIAAQAAFRVLAPPRPRSWNDYVALLGDGCETVDPAFWRGLGRNGIQGGVVVSLEPGTELVRQGALFLSNALPHEGNPLHLSGNWTARLRAYAGSREAKLLERQPPLFDDKVLAGVRADMEKSVALKGAMPPLGWALGDRLSLTQDAHPFDYDMSPRTLEVLRAWLEDNYGSLSALNRQWGTEYKYWGEVTPPTTDAAKSANNPAYAACLKALTSPPPAPAVEPKAGEKPAVEPKAGEKPAVEPKAGEKPAPQAPALPEAKWEERDGLRGFSLAPEQLCAPGHENFSAWSDWRAFCDFAFGRLLREYRTLIRESAHAKTVPAGLLGAEAPAAWGGWDYSTLAKSVDYVEEHNSVLARELFRSFAPAAHCLSSFSGSQDDDLRRLWDRWLRGDSGCILQQHQRWLASPDYQPAPAAKAFLAELRCLTGGLTLLRGQALPENNAVALYYSPRSIQLHWMLDSEAEGSWWLNRDGAFEAAHGSALLQMEAWWTLLEDLGHAPRFVSPQQLLAGDLLARKAPRKAEAAGVKVLILPKVLALSDDEADAIRSFARAGGVVIADGACGTFDGHGKRRQPLFVTAAADMGAVGNLDRDFGIARRNLRVLERNGAFLGDDTARLSFRGTAMPPSDGCAPESSELRILEPGVVAADARGHAVSRGGTAALLASAFPGRGRFVYLNLAMQDYPQLRARKSAGDFRFQGMSTEEYAKTYGQPTGGEALRLVIGDILSDVLPDCPPRVRALDGTPVRALKRVRFNLGKDAWLFALLPTGPTGLAAASMRQENVPGKSAPGTVARTRDIVVIPEPDNTIQPTEPAELRELEKKLDIRMFRLAYVSPEEPKYTPVFQSSAAQREADTAGGQAQGTASLIDVLKKVKSRAGTISFEKRSKTIIVRDFAKVLERMQAIVSKLDVPPAAVAGETLAEQVWVGLDKKSYWYDVRAGQCLGLEAMVKTALDPNRPALLGALPYLAEKLKLKVRRTDPRGLFKVEAGLVVDEGEPGTHVFHVEVSGPDGQLLPHYTRNVTAKEGRWAAEVALALNEPTGTYQLTVRDALTGNAATGSLLKDFADYTSFSTPLKP